MRAVVYSEAGGPDVLRVVERPVPEPGPGEVRVAVQVSGVRVVRLPEGLSLDVGASLGIPR